MDCVKEDEEEVGEYVGLGEEVSVGESVEVGVSSVGEGVTVAGESACVEEGVGVGVQVGEKVREGVVLREEVLVCVRICSAEVVGEEERDRLKEGDEERAGV
mmetsp:Transcript_13547/g.22295  ORF Transcript_13547/g.22295 Transcript_13547/m.22295 type:complete len:102 (-) Transcript_13547:340-645(-)